MKVTLIKFSTKIAAFVVLASFAVSCSHLLPPSPAENEILDGPIEGLTMEQQRIFLAGDEAFGDLIFSPETGLGPIFVQASCGSCHAGDGKGHPFTALKRFGKMESGAFNHLLDAGGPQLQNRAIPGSTVEKIPGDATGITTFIPPAVTGLGFLEAVKDQTILDLADPNDDDGDGISGTVNYINPPWYFEPKAHHIPNNGKYIGRFGRKAGAVNLLNQTVGALKQDMGITSDFDMVDPINYNVSSQHVDGVPDPEIAAATIHDIVFYLRTLKAPIHRNEKEKDFAAGKNIFLTIGCDKCHTPSMTTGDSDIKVLSNKTFSPYSDMLMHDMGQELDDGYTEGSASTAEWRTTPLWGIGLAPDAQGDQHFLMHDGRASIFEEAIELHGGEGSQSRTAFRSLSEAEKEQLYYFLNSL